MDTSPLFQTERLVSSPRGLTVVVHGYAEHCGRYEHVAERLTSLGLSTLLYDHRGHGKSPGLKAFIANMDDLVADLAGQIKTFQRLRGPSLPLFVVAHSMGGGIALKCALVHRPKVHGYVLSAPLVKVSSKLSPILQRLAPLAAALVPEFPIGDSGGSAALSRDVAVCDAFEKDPLCYSDKVRAKTGHELLKLCRFLTEHIKDFQDRFLLLHGTADLLAEPTGSELLFREARSKDKTYVPLQNFYHEVFNEPERSSVLDTVTTWIEERLKAPAG